MRIVNKDSYARTLINSFDIYGTHRVRTHTHTHTHTPTHTHTHTYIDMFFEKFRVYYIVTEKNRAYAFSGYFTNLDTYDLHALFEHPISR